MGCLGMIASAYGCADDSSSAHGGAHIDTTGSGVVQIRNTVDGLWTEETRWTLEEVVRIGTLEGDAASPYVFGSISTLSLDDLGRVWTFDRQAMQLRVFDRDGGHVRTVGHEGDGPGEFRRGLEAILPGPDGRIWTLDQGGNVVNVFDTAGAFVRSYPYQSSSADMRWRGVVDRGGHFYSFGTDFVAGRSFFIRRGPEFEALDTLRTPVHPDGPARWTLSDGPSVYGVDIPYKGVVEYTMAGDGGLWAAIADRYELLRFGPEGDTLLRSTKPFDPVPLTDEEREAALTVELLGQKIDPGLIPNTKPIVRRIFTDDEDRVWVIVTARGEDEGRRVDVFSAEGIYLGEIRTPVSVEHAPLSVRKGLFATVAKDSLDVERVLVAEIRRGS